MLLLAQLPLLFERAIEQLSGLRGGASVYRSLQRLSLAGLIAAVRPPLQPGHAPQLFYLTDLGLATLGILQQIEPAHLARRSRLRGSDLLALLPGLPQLVAAYELLAALAASRPGRPDLLAWERPWRRRYQRPTAKAPVAVGLPALAALVWEGEAASGPDRFLLLPDLASAPLRTYRSALDHLLVLRSIESGSFPALIIATSDRRRAAAWGQLLEEARRVRSEAPLRACVATWDDLHAGLAGLLAAGDVSLSGGHLVRHVRLRPLKPRRAQSALPALVGDALAVAANSAAAALSLTPADRLLLDLLGLHPFLSVEHLAAVLGCDRKYARQRRNRLVAMGLAHLVTEREVGAQAAALELVELTGDGLTLLAAQQGLSLAAAVRHNGLAGGGPDRPTGGRPKLLANLAHTLGANALFVGLLDTARKLTAAGSEDALVEWQNAAACSRWHLRPDGYGIYRHAGQLYGFFLEYDRGTMSSRDYLKKLAAYHDYLASGRFERDYDGFPTILVVTANNSAEERIARAARTAAVGRTSRLPILLTCEWRIRDRRNPYGLLAPIWREPDAGFDERRPWPLNATTLPRPPACQGEYLVRLRVPGNRTRDAGGDAGDRDV